MDGLYLKDFLICNVAVVDTDLANGAIDVLPGTNREFYKFWRYAARAQVPADDPRAAAAGRRHPAQVDAVAPGHAQPHERAATDDGHHVRRGRGHRRPIRSPPTTARSSSTRTGTGRRASAGCASGRSSPRRSRTRRTGSPARCTATRGTRRSERRGVGGAQSVPTRRRVERRTGHEDRAGMCQPRHVVGRPQLPRRRPVRRRRRSTRASPCSTPPNTYGSGAERAHRRTGRCGSRRDTVEIATKGGYRFRPRTRPELAARQAVKARAGPAAPRRPPARGRHRSGAQLRVAGLLAGRAPPRARGQPATAAHRPRRRLPAARPARRAARRRRGAAGVRGRGQGPPPRRRRRDAGRGGVEWSSVPGIDVVQLPLGVLDPEAVAVADRGPPPRPGGVGTGASSEAVCWRPRCADPTRSAATRRRPSSRSLRDARRPPRPRVCSTLAFGFVRGDPRHLHHPARHEHRGAPPTEPRARRAPHRWRPTCATSLDVLLDAYQRRTPRRDERRRPVVVIGSGPDRRHRGRPPGRARDRRLHARRRHPRARRAARQGRRQHDLPAASRSELVGRPLGQPRPAADVEWHSSLSLGGLSNYWTAAVPRFAPSDFTEGAARRRALRVAGHLRRPRTALRRTPNGC